MAAVGKFANGAEVPGCVVKEIEKRLYKTLKDVFKYDSYRSLVQKRAVEAVANSNQDVFVSMPTGAGKSLCYQLPSIVSERSGVTIVVSPLIALMTNQIEQMKAVGICTESINSKMGVSERDRVKADLMSNSPCIKLLYITPELAGTSGFHSILNHLYNNNNVARIVVDEAHCVSQWGHSFRPDYLRLGELREKFLSIPWLALTATASVKVMDDVFTQLKLSQPIAIFKTSCFRPNLFYDVVFKELIDDSYEDLKEFAYTSLGDHWEMTPPSERGCGIIYCRTRDSCEEVALRLTRLGLKTQAYHAGMKPKLRQETQANWMDGRTAVIAATVSFGMGIDKPSVRFVAHWCVSQSLAAYYQESGRAGRDGETAHCRIYYSQKDRDTIQFLLKKDENASLSKVSKIKSSAAIKSFASVIKYCEEATCRHYLLSREFGDDIPDCKKFCDVCCSLKSIEHKISLFRSIKLGSKFEKQRNLSSYDDLYGGGRKGAEDDSEAYHNNEENDDERERKAGKMLKNFISEEFSKRRANRAISDKILKSDKVLEPSLKKVNGLSLEAREKYYDKLECELRKNVDACKSNSQCPKLTIQDLKICAADYELTAFKSKNNIHSYRKDFLQLYKSLQEATRQVEIHPIVSKYVPKINHHNSPTKSKKNGQTIFDMFNRQRTKNHDLSNTKMAVEKRKFDKCRFSDSCDSETSTNASPRKRKSSRSESSKSSVSSKPMIKYFFESVTGHLPSQLSPEQCSFLSPRSPIKTEPSTSGSTTKKSNSTDGLPSPKKVKTSEHEIRVKLPATTEKKKEPMKTTSQIQNDNLKKAADLVRKHLNPQYKANKISKDLFKIVCRSISHRLVEAGAVNDKAAKLEVEKLFEQLSNVENLTFSAT